MVLFLLSFLLRAGVGRRFGVRFGVVSCLFWEKIYKDFIVGRGLV